MRHGELSREQVVGMFGEQLIDELDNLNCEPTGRVQTDGDPDTEYCASIRLDDGEYDGCIVTAYYYTTPSEEQVIADMDGDMSCIDWQIHGYDVV